MIKRVVVSKYVQKQLHWLPTHVVAKLWSWVRNVELRGIEEVRRVVGLHDEPLKGKRKGERSIRLSRGYRAIYRVIENHTQLIFIEEVTKHEY